MFSLMKLSENDKRVIIAALLIIIVLFILFGYFVRLIKHTMNVYGRGIDTYVAEMINYNILTKPKEIRKYVFKRENSILFKKLAIPTYIFIGVLVTFILIGDFELIEPALRSLALRIKWPVGRFFGIKTFPIDWPSFGRPDPMLTKEAYIVYLFSLVSIVYLFMLCRRTLIFFSRLIRASKKSKAVFSKSLDNISVEQF